MTTIQYASKFEYLTAVSELTVQLHKVKAIADAYAHHFIEGTDAMNELALKAAPEMHLYLFTAMTDELFKALQIAESINE